MSAFIVSHDHISALCRIAIERLDVHGKTVVDESFEEFMREDLYRQNCMSVMHRYDDQDMDAYESHDWCASSNRIAMMCMPCDVQALKWIDCYEYQSCEHPSYGSSFTWTLLRNLERRIAYEHYQTKGTTTGWDHNDPAEYVSRHLEDMRSTNEYRVCSYHLQHARQMTKGEQ